MAEKLSPSVRTTSHYDTNGVMGSGKWYGVPNYAEYTMVYYNKDLFKKYGIAEPKTFDELTAAMDTFVENKVTPLANGGSNTYCLVSGRHRALFSALQAFTVRIVTGYVVVTKPSPFLPQCTIQLPR